MRILTSTLLLVALMVPQAAHAVITFTQLDDDVFVVSHRIKVIGSRGKAMKMAYEKVASLCVAAGYSHYSILDEESGAAQEGQAGNASVRAKFFLSGGDDRIECRRNANKEYIQQARQKLERQGYEPPDPGAVTATGTEPSNGTLPKSCTLEQIATMARAGLTDDQIRKACEDEGGG